MKKHFLRLLNLILLPIEFIYAIGFLIVIVIAGLYSINSQDDDGD